MPPRPSVLALAGCIAISVILLLRQFSTYSYSSYYRDVFSRGHPLKDWLNDEEERYAAFIQDRQQLIKKYGPTEALVEPWVFPAMLSAHLHFVLRHTFCAVPASLHPIISIYLKFSV